MDTIERPSASIPQAAGDDGQAKATYRFYANARVATEALHHGFALEAARRCLDQDVLLVVQDTTTLNFTGLQQPSPNSARSIPAGWPAACTCTPPWP